MPPSRAVSPEPEPPNHRPRGRMYDGGRCPHHARPIRHVPQPGTDQLLELCDDCEAEWLGAVDVLAGAPDHRRRSA